MSADKMVDLVISTEDHATTSGSQGEPHGEDISIDGQTPGNKHMNDSHSGFGVMPASDEHTALSEQVNGPSTEENAKVVEEPALNNSRLGSKEDSTSEGTDNFEEFAQKPSKAPKPLKQFFDYIKLMEDRMAAMESQLQKANTEPTVTAPGQETSIEPQEQNLINSKTKEPPPSPPPPPPPKQLQLSIAFLKWDQFDRIGTSGNHVIDVLIGDVRVPCPLHSSHLFHPKRREFGRSSYFYRRRD